MLSNLKLLCRAILTTLQSNHALADQFGISATTVGRYKSRLAEEGLDADAIGDWDDARALPVLNPADRRDQVGQLIEARQADIDAAFARSAAFFAQAETTKAQWPLARKRAACRFRPSAQGWVSVMDERSARAFAYPAMEHARSAPS